MSQSSIDRLLVAATAVACACLSACGGDDSPPLVTAGAPAAGPTPFIATVQLSGDALSHAEQVRFTIAKKPGTVSRPVTVTYTMAYLQRRGDVAGSPANITVPVFGLYAGTTNPVTFDVRYDDGRTSRVSTTVATAAWTDPHAVYDHATVVKARAPDERLGFDFFYLKSLYGSPVIVDTDGQVRWVGPDQALSMASDYDDGGFVVGGYGNPDIYRMELDGTYATTGSLAATGVTAFSHDVERGKSGFIGTVDVVADGVTELESTAQEFTVDGQTIATWDMARSVADLMTAGGDDASQFVRPGTDWFHMNTAIYDASDDSVIVSSRENFVAKVDYATGEIRWILGDPSKYWYTFPSLRAKALTWLGDGLVPIGQHSVTIAPDGSLMVFNNGHASANQPASAPAGTERPYSAVSDYVIDETARTVREAWHFDYGQSISSIVCSSARATSDGSILVDYAIAENQTAARLVGLDPSHQVVFDIRYPTSGCNTAWNAQPIALDDLQID